MTKFGLGNIFQYNSEISACRFFSKVEVSWVDGTWRHPSEWVFDYNHTACECHILEVGWFGITILGKFCKGKYQ